jgi:hypothetical protein
MKKWSQPPPISKELKVGFSKDNPPWLISFPTSGQVQPKRNIGKRAKLSIQAANFPKATSISQQDEPMGAFLSYQYGTAKRVI